MHEHVSYLHVVMPMVYHMLFLAEFTCLLLKPCCLVVLCLGSVGGKTQLSTCMSVCCSAPKEYSTEQCKWLLLVCFALSGHWPLSYLEFCHQL